MSDIAAPVGFLDSRPFERALRRQYGMTPSGRRCEHCHSESDPANLKQEMSRS
jgi:AraC-like DNA-binding protein